MQETIVYLLVAVAAIALVMKIRRNIKNRGTCQGCPNAGNCHNCKPE